MGSALLSPHPSFRIEQRSLILCLLPHSAARLGWSMSSRKFHRTSLKCQVRRLGAAETPIGRTPLPHLT